MGAHQKPRQPWPADKASQGYEPNVIEIYEKNDRCRDVGGDFFDHVQHLHAMSHLSIQVITPDMPAYDFFDYFDHGSYQNILVIAMCRGLPYRL